MNFEPDFSSTTLPTMKNNTTPTKIAVFLDRDGTLNIDTSYPASLDDIELLPGAIEAVRLLNEAGILAIVVTNQSGVARGYFSEERVLEINAGITRWFEEGCARIDGWYYCPHHPTAGEAPYRKECDCRKPGGGMLLQAAKDFDLDLSRCYMIGDKLSDVEAGLRLKMTTVLVNTGEGKLQAVKAAADKTLPQPDHVLADVLAAAKYIVENASSLPPAK
ncbi:MAG: D-glycero-alpha-D-manno-heptose-1,7-bisphosphate 7-phosphatase [Calditrichia bacterium]